MTEGIDVQSHNGDPITLGDGKCKDLYGYHESAKKLAKILEHCATPFVVGVYGRWGRGKSTFLNTLRNELNSPLNAASGFRHLTYSPWNYHLQTFNDVWISFISELTSNEELAGGTMISTLKDIARDINAWKATKTVLGIGADLIPGGAAMKGLIESLPKGSDKDNEYAQFIKAKRRFEQAIKSHCTMYPSGRVFIYIDDIDRCEPQTSVSVLRTIQVLCRTKGCVFLLGIDRDVIIKNLTQVYQDPGYAKEYLDKVVQLHVELPFLSVSEAHDALLYDSSGQPRQGIESFVEWIAASMDYNPRKIERFIYLYDYKLHLEAEKIGKNGDTFHAYRWIVLFTLWNLKWPELTSEIARSPDMLDATNQLLEANNKQAQDEVLEKYARFPVLKSLRDGGEFLHFFREISKIKDPAMSQKEKAMTFEIRQYVASPDDEELQDIYDVVNQLVNDAGNITIRDLFTKSPEDISISAWKAIQQGKSIGFLNISSKSCCKNHNCRSAGNGWCSSSLNGQGCTIVSSPCAQH